MTALVSHRQVGGEGSHRGCSSVVARAIVPLDTTVARDAYRTGDFPRADRVNDLDKRYRWDLFWHAYRTNHDVSAALAAEDLSDAHIDTVLRSIVPSL